MKSIKHEDGNSSKGPKIVNPNISLAMDGSSQYKETKVINPKDSLNNSLLMMSANKDYTQLGSPDRTSDFRGQSDRLNDDIHQTLKRVPDSPDVKTKDLSPTSKPITHSA